MRNGPGRFEVGQRKFYHIFDGFAKLEKFHFEGDGQTVTFTNKFVETSSYKSFIAENDIDPYLYMAQRVPEFSIRQKIEQIMRNTDSSNVNVLKFGSDYVTVSDYWKVYSFNQTNLITIKPIYPEVSGMPPSFQLKNSMTTSHPLPVSGTDY